jgi:hypothetical protein
VEDYMERALMLAVASVCGCWEAYQHHGLDRVQQQVMNEVEKAKQQGIGLARLAIALERHMASWSCENKKVVQNVFASYDIPVFKKTEA